MNGFRYEQFMSFATVVLVILKLCGLIGCSWWWVFSPLWIPPAMCLFAVFVAMLIEWCGMEAHFFGEIEENET